MAIRLTDAEIAAYLTERKELPAGLLRDFRMRPKQGHDVRDFDLRGEDGNAFRVILRQNQFNRFDFSAIVALVPQAGAVFRLRRYNGKAHQHSNVIERTPVFYDFHIHEATARYQERGFREDAFALPTTEYADLRGAVRCMLRECGFALADDPQAPLFESL
jgi:hypothetical protein